MISRLLLTSLVPLLKARLITILEALLLRLRLLQKPIFTSVMVVVTIRKRMQPSCFLRTVRTGWFTFRRMTSQLKAFTVPLLRQPTQAFVLWGLLELTQPT